MLRFSQSAAWGILSTGRQGEGAARLDPPMAMIDRLVAVHRPTRVVGGIGIDEQLFHRLRQRALIAFERQDRVPAARDDLLCDRLLATCLASMVRIQPLRSSISNTSGMAVIALDLASVACCARTNPLAALQALTRCNGPKPFLRQCEQRRLLPSMATISSPHTSRTDATHSRNRASKTSGDNTENTRPKVS